MSQRFDDCNSSASLLEKAMRKRKMENTSLPTIPYVFGALSKGVPHGRQLRQRVQEPK
jgi:hypothetical protein